MNTMRVQAFAKFFTRVSSVEELQELFDTTCWQDETKLFLGGGSNILFAGNFDGLVVKNDILGRDIVYEDDKVVHLKAGSGENWHQLVLYTLDKGWGGIENLSLIPGTTGAAPIQNIGAYGVELEEVFVCLEAFNIKTGKIETFNKKQCVFGYRNSIFKNELKGKYLISSVTLALSKNPDVNLSYQTLADYIKQKGLKNPSPKQVSDAVIEIRNSKLPDPKQLGNCGSFFKNPVISGNKFEQLQKEHPEVPHYPASNSFVKVPAGWLIEQTGWKGKKAGKAGTYPKQALVIVNYGEEDGKKIWQLAKRIQQDVKKEFGIELETEVNVIC